MLEFAKWNRYILHNVWFIFGYDICKYVYYIVSFFVFMFSHMLNIIYQMKLSLNFYINYLEMHFGVPKIIHFSGHLYLFLASRCTQNLQTIAKSGFSRKKRNLIFKQFCRFKLFPLENIISLSLFNLYVIP